MIKLKRKELNRIYSILDTVKLNKIDDAEIRKVVLRIVLGGKKDATIMQNDVEDTRRKYFDEFKSEDLIAFQDGINEVTKLLIQNKKEEAAALDKKLGKKYPKLLKAYQSFNSAITELQNDEVELNIEPVSSEDFVEAMLGQDLDITGNFLESFTSIFKNESEN